LLVTCSHISSRIISSLQSFQEWHKSLLINVSCLLATPRFLSLVCPSPLQRAFTLFHVLSPSGQSISYLHIVRLNYIRLVSHHIAISATEEHRKIGRLYVGIESAYTNTICAHNARHIRCFHLAAPPRVSLPTCILLYPARTVPKFNNNSNRLNDFHYI
jgi:hypothetical protein